MATVLITGGAGFIGSHTVDAFLRAGHAVVALDNLRNGKEENLSEASKNSKFTFIKGDILDPTICMEATRNVDVVYHLACLGVRHSLHSPIENHEVNASGTLNLLQSTKENGVRKFFYISTSEVYGKNHEFPICEDCVPKPITVYGSSKLAGEHLTNSYYECFGIDTTVLRIFNNYGPRAHHEGDSGEVIPRTIVNALYGQQPVIFGTGEITRDFFFVEDTARILAKLVDIEGLSGGTYNIGTGQEITIKALLEQVLSVMSKDSLGIKYLPNRPGDVPRLWVDASKLRQIIDFGNLMDFSDGLQQTVEYYTEMSKSRELIAEIEELNWKK